MKKNIKEYKEIVEVVADIQEMLEMRKHDIEREIKRYEENEDYKENEYYQETVERYERKGKAINEVINNLEKLL